MTDATKGCDELSKIVVSVQGDDAMNRNCEKKSTVPIKEQKNGRNTLLELRRLKDLENLHESKKRAVIKILDEFIKQD